MKFGVITDIHLYPDPNTQKRFAWHNPYPMQRAMAQYDAALERCLAEGVDAIAILGDIAHIGDGASLDVALERAATTGKPVWVTPGNHDCTVRADAIALAVGKRARSRVTLLDAVGERDAALAGWRLAGLPVASDDGGDSARSLEQPALDAWQDDPVIFLTHFPMLSLAEQCAAAGLKYAGDLRNYADTTAHLQQRSAPTLVLHGHLHVRDELARDSLLQLSFAALIEPPHEMAILELDGDSRELALHRRNVSIASHAAARLPVLAQDETRWQLRDGAWRAG